MCSEKNAVINEFLKKNPKLFFEDVELDYHGYLLWFCKCGNSHIVYSPKNDISHVCGCDCCRSVVPIEKIKAYKSQVTE